MALMRGPDKGQGCNPFTGLLGPSLAYPHHGVSVGISPLGGGGEAPHKAAVHGERWPGLDTWGWRTQGALIRV